MQSLFVGPNDLRDPAFAIHSDARIICVNDEHRSTLEAQYAGDAIGRRTCRHSVLRIPLPPIHCTAKTVVDNGDGVQDGTYLSQHVTRGNMETPFKTPEQLLQYRSLKQVLADKGTTVYRVSPGDPIFSALELMAKRSIGFLTVDENGKLVGVLSERDYARKVILQGRASKETPVRDIMTKDVVTVTIEQTVPQCMALMNKHGFRHLPVMSGDEVVGVLSIRDLLKEIVAHHERLIRDMELERTAMLSGGTSY
jgi:CBS domain-containing protein